MKEEKTSGVSGPVFEMFHVNEGLSLLLRKKKNLFKEYVVKICFWWGKNLVLSRSKFW